MVFRFCLSPFCFGDQLVASCSGLLLKGPWFTFAHTEIGGSASFASLNMQKILVCFHFIYRCSPIWTSFSLSWRFYRTNAGRPTWTWGTFTFLTIYYSASRQFDFYLPSSRSRRFNNGHGFTNNFIRMGRRYCYYTQSTSQSSNAGWVYFWCASW